MVAKVGQRRCRRSHKQWRGQCVGVIYVAVAVLGIKIHALLAIHFQPTVQVMLRSFRRSG